MNKPKTLIVIFLAVILFQTAFASATIITYNLSDKHFGAKAMPDYGLRLDDLFDSPTESNWTFSYDVASADVQMDINTVTAEVHIYGTVVGGRDIGSIWDPTTVAGWALDFTYSDGVTINDPTLGYWTVAFDANNFGTLELLDAINLDGIDDTDNGKYIALSDFHGGSFSDTTSKGPYVSAWLESTDGFVAGIDSTTNFVRPNDGKCCKDFGFRATPAPVPEPGTLILMGSGLAGILFFRRKIQNTPTV